MATTQGIGRSMMMPVILSGAVLASLLGGGYAVYKQIEPQQQRPAATAQQPSQGSIDDKVGATATPTIVVPQHIEKPATLQEIGGPEGITKDYVVHVAKWVGQELGVPLDPNLTLDILSEKDYLEKAKQMPNSHLIMSSIGFISPDGLNIYLKGAVEPARLVGLALNETGKGQLGYLQKQRKVVMPSKEMKLELVEAAAFAYQAASQRFLEEKLGFGTFFTPLSHYEVKDLASQFMNGKIASQQKRDVTYNGFMVFTYAVFNEPQFSGFAQSLKEGKKMTPEQEMQVFYFLLKQDDTYARNAIDKVGEKEFNTLAEIIIGRKGTPLIRIWNYYDNKLP